MTVTETTPQTIDRAVDADERTDDEVLVEEDVLVEEISIDGMCGVY